MASILDILHYQPFKALFTLLYVSYNVPRLVFWMIYYIPPFLRQHPAWSHKQAVRVRLVRAALYNMSMVEMKTPLSLLPGKEKDRFVVLSPAPEASYVDAVSSDPRVRPEKIGLTWYPRVPSRSDSSALSSSSDTVILHFHGGAYAIGDGRTQDAGFAAKTLIAQTSATFVAAPQYRLSSNPGCRFPAQLQDAVTSYAYLINEVGIPANKIVLSGDSAGANLALALARYLTYHGTKVSLPLPAAALLWSCWAHPATSIELGTRALDAHPNGKIDYVSGDFGLWGAKTMMPSATSGHGIDSPYISFLDHAFKTDIPLYFSTGECEVLLSDDIKLADQFRKIKGNEVALQVEEHCVHDTILAAPLVGFEKEAELAAKRAGIWLRTVAEAAAAPQKGRL